MTANTDDIAEAVTGLPLLYRGKVRDLYQIDDQHLLIVASDRLSAFDVVLPDGIPGKGAVLTAMARFWFDKFSDVIENHLDLARKTLEQAIPDPVRRAVLEDRAVVARRLQPLPIEAIVRGYLSGSGWLDYCRNGRVSGIELPPGLAQAERLPEPIFTPSTKARLGDHDENIDFAQAAELVGPTLAEQIRSVSVNIYRQAADYARRRGIIIADTKFEFGLSEDRRLALIDEILTPDSSRFWPLDQYRTGTSPPSLDKQYVRDYLNTLDWDKTAPGPSLPPQVVRRTAAIYRAALQRLTGAVPGL